MQTMKLTNQNRLTGTLVLVLLGCFFQLTEVTGQTLKVNINVKSTVGMQPMKSFDLVPEEAMETATPGFSSMQRSVSSIGGFAITGKENSDILIRVNAPEVLVNREKQTMPFRMDIAWQNSDGADLRTLNWSGRKVNVLKLSGNEGRTQKNRSEDNDLQAFVYLKSTSEIPAKAGSPFEGDIHVTIEY
jgi:hypothetical protein